MAEGKIKMTPLVEIHDGVMEFPGVKALDQVNFTLMPGECHALVGENGAGKYVMYEGEILDEVEGERKTQEVIINNLLGVNAE